MRRYDDNLFFKDNIKEYTYEEYDYIADYYRYKAEHDNSGCYVDDITWHDMDMDHVFMKINNSNSSLGQEYLYYRLRKQDEDIASLEETDRIASYIQESETDRKKLSSVIYDLGFVRKISMIKYLTELKNAPVMGNLIHYVGLIAFIASILCTIFVDAGIGVSGFFVMLVFQIMGYYKFRAKVEPYFVCVNYLAKMHRANGRILKLKLKELENYEEELSGIKKKLEPVMKNSFLLSDTNSNDGSLIEMFMSYVRMLTHVDLIKFNNIVDKVPGVMEDVLRLYEIVGFFDACTSIASYRTRVKNYVKPEFVEGKSIEIVDGVHPLIDDAVSNSIDCKRCVLLTGSNASGKSTFLRMVGINAILAQSIYTCLCKSYKASRFRVYSSMSLSDDLLEHDSYYMVEIKSLRRILTADTSVPVLCFIDEVLRGTNTIERIAASSIILKTFSTMNVICFAATHDIELTGILEKHYDNYHFTEEVVDNDVRFSYRLLDGKATSRNAIRLLEILGYDAGIISDANALASDFERTMEWGKI